AGNSENSSSEDSSSKNSGSKDSDSKDSNSDKENIPLTIMLKNLYKAATKSRPKSSSHKNNKKEKQLVKKLLNGRKRKCGPNQCSYCKITGYNIATCSKKAI
ncbi:3980_t:CDS:1, partial [Dentiscutata heterogama]